MKKLLLILLCLPMIGFGQLGDYYISDGKLKNNGLEFKFKKPNGYVQFSGQIPTTIVGFSKKDAPGEIEFYISIYNLEQFELQHLKNASKSELKDMIVSAEDLQYYELSGYPGWIGEEGAQGYSSLQSFTFIRNNIFVIKATVRNKYMPSEIEELFYKMSNTLEFTNTHSLKSPKTDNYKLLGDYYKPKGHPKAKGLNFEIKTPLGFEQMEADRPNIVQKWIKNRKDNNTMVLFMVLVYNLPVELQDASQNEWKQYFKFETGVEDVSKEIGNTSNAKYYVLDNYSGLVFDSTVEMDRTEFTATTYQRTAQVYLNKHIFLIQMFSMKEDLLEENSRLFHSLANSVIFPDQYGN